MVTIDLPGLQVITDQEREHPYGNVLLVGPAKTGKSTAASSAPGLVGIINADQPNATEYAHERYGQRLVEMKLSSRLREMPMKNTLGAVMRACYPSSGSPVIDSWVLDPIGEAHRRLRRELSNDAVRPSRDVYGDVLAILEAFVDFMCEAPCNFILVAHEYPVKDEVAGIFRIQPFTGTSNPGLGQKLLGKFDVIAYTGTIETEENGLQYVAQIVPTEGRPVGVRGRFNRLLTDEVRAKKYVPLDLSEWFRVAGKHMGSTPVEQDSAPVEEPVKTAA